MEQTEWEKITENIKVLVEKNRKTKSQIAAEIGISRPTLSQYLSGRAFPSLVTLKKLCEVLDCEYEEILGREQINEGL